MTQANIYQELCKNSWWLKAINYFQKKTLKMCDRVLNMVSGKLPGNSLLRKSIVKNWIRTNKVNTFFFIFFVWIKIHSVRKIFFSRLLDNWTICCRFRWTFSVRKRFLHRLLDYSIIECRFRWTFIVWENVFCQLLNNSIIGCRFRWTFIVWQNVFPPIIW